MAFKQMFDEFITKAALHTVMERFPDDYKKASDQGKIKELRKATEVTVSEVNQMLHAREKGFKLKDVLVQLPGDRINGMAKALGKKTFEMTTDGQVVKVTRDGAMFLPDISLTCLNSNRNKASKLQIASIVVECVILILELIGVDIPDDEEEVKKAIQIALDDLDKSKTLINDVDKIQKDYEKGDYPAMAKDMFVLVVDSFHEDIFWDMTKALLSGMPWYDWIITSAQIAAFIAMLVATEGVAEIAELVVELTKAAFFLEKLANLVNLKEIEMKTKWDCHCCDLL
ncbi:uncharacterized protein LOC121409643 [Lytechinus variegatus]|uniref:uncharacterized protein LOC121409643 n=1 Tax=Lytechinus variegatus TaxID=7654 RepID=UPI001BB16D06|nr:uncharacterized protein LOC121409643 [Lytechinus variegatus]